MSKHGTGATPNQPRTITFGRRRDDNEAVTCPVCDDRVGNNDGDMSSHASSHGFNQHNVR